MRQPHTNPLATPMLGARHCRVAACIAGKSSMRGEGGRGAWAAWWSWRGVEQMSCVVHAALELPGDGPGNRPTMVAHTCRLRKVRDEGVFDSRMGVEQVWSRCGAGVEQMWSMCGDDVEHVWRRCGGGVEQMWSKCGRRGRTHAQT